MGDVEKYAVTGEAENLYTNVLELTGDSTMTYGETTVAMVFCGDHFHFECGDESMKIKPDVLRKFCEAILLKIKLMEAEEARVTEDDA